MFIHLSKFTEKVNYLSNGNPRPSEFNFIEYPMKLPQIKLTRISMRDFPIKVENMYVYTDRNGDTTSEPFEVVPFTNQKIRGGFRSIAEGQWVYSIPNTPQTESRSFKRKINVSIDSESDLSEVDVDDLISFKYETLLAFYENQGFNEIEGVEEFLSFSNIVSSVRPAKNKQLLILPPQIELRYNEETLEFEEIEYDMSEVVFEISSDSPIKSFLVDGLITNQTMRKTVSTIEYEEDDVWTEIVEDSKISLNGLNSTVKIRISNDSLDPISVHWVAFLKEI